MNTNKYTYGTETLIDEHVYTYGNSGWQDQLTKYDNESITYDAIGNPLTMGDKTFTWRNGRELASYSDTNNNISYIYNNDGIRTSKTVNNVTTNYYLKGNKIVFEEKNNTMLYFIYNNDELVGFKYNGNTYHYHKNLFGDVIGIYDSNNNEIVTYEYDSWGALVNIIDNSNINLSTINPFRYRSYYYDEETKLYYLNSRYYNPKVGRFINADAYVSTGQGTIGHNMYNYCGNSPINRKDSFGTIWNPLLTFRKNVKIFIQNNIGAESTSSKTLTEKPYSSKSGPVSYSTNLYTTMISPKAGDSSKPITIYANANSDNLIKSSSIGVNIKIDTLSFNINLSLDDIGTDVSYSGKDYTSTFGTRINISEFKVGYENSNTVEIGENLTKTSSINTSVDGWFIIAACVFVTTGVPLPRFSGFMIPAFA